MRSSGTHPAARKPEWCWMNRLTTESGSTVDWSPSACFSVVVVRGVAYTVTRGPGETTEGICAAEGWVEATP